MKARVAVIGLGKMGLLHASILNMLENARLVAVCEKHRLVRRFARRILPNIAVEANLNDLAEMNLDAIYITTPEASHYPIIREIYRKNIASHVFCEKPLAIGYEQSQQLCQLVDGKGGNMVGYNRRYIVTFDKVRELLAREKVGTVSHFEVHAYSSDFCGVKQDGVSFQQGMLSDLGCHAIDLAIWYFGALECVGAPQAGSGEVNPPDWVHCQLRAKEGVVPLHGEFKGSRRMRNYRLPEIGIAVHGARGTLRANQDMVTLDLGPVGKKCWYIHDLDNRIPFFLGGAEYYRESESFVKAILNGIPASPDFLAASRVEQVIDQILTADKESYADSESAVVSCWG